MPVTDVGGIPASPNAKRRVHVRLASLVVVLVVIYLATYGANRFTTGTPGVADWWPPTVAVSITIATAVLSVATARRSTRSIVRGSAIFAAVYAACYVAWFAAWDGRMVPPDIAGWLEGLSVVASIAAAIAWRTRDAIVYAVAMTALTRFVYYSAVAPHGGRFIIVVLTGNLVLSVICAAASRIAIAAANAVDANWVANHRLAARDAAERARQEERGRVGDLLHDFILAALLAAARQPDDDAVRDEARQALAQLDQYSAESPPTTAGSAAIDKIAVSCQAAGDVHLIIRSAESEYPGPVVDAIADGAREAVRNSHRHAGRDVDVVVTIDAGPDHLVVDVTDDGPGFAGTPAGRYGLARMRERMASVPDATLRVESDRGTTVRLTWSRPSTSSQMTHTGFRDLLDLHDAHMWAAVAMLGVGNTVIVATYAGAAIPVWSSAAAIILGWVAAYYLFVPLADPLPLVPALVVACGIPCAEALLLLTATPPVTSQMLGAGYVSVAYAIGLGLRGRLWAATVLTAACAATPVMFIDRTGQSMDYWIGEVVSWAVGLFLCVFFARTIRPLMRSLRRLQAESYLRHASAAESSSAIEHRKRHLARVDERARPILTRIVEEPLSPELRQHSAITEAQLRSALRAPGLINEALDSAAYQARVRGVNVVLIDDSTREAFDDRAAFERFASTAATALGEAGRSTRVTIRLTPEHSGPRATIVTTRHDDTVRRIGVDSSGAVSDR
ncbi:hypothetical protein HH308_28070 [Gordonia sp. TBRC 11910]|uniref:Signal transduction histidine kinase n=1 Tax=Gordonia asplenii TaxID=2725283 RepID=A0A848L2L6_9ACTN|nr:hypothetical protein [Gordonia asplenii]NMO05084.1 hypothetical protein [Gordonia asplenii]